LAGRLFLANNAQGDANISQTYRSDAGHKKLGQYDGTTPAIYGCHGYSKMPQPLMVKAQQTNCFNLGAKS